MYTNLKGKIKVRNLTYSWTGLMRTRLFRIPRYFELETISLGSLLQYFTIGYFERFFVPLASSKYWGSTVYKY